MADPNPYSGSCHCGAVAFTVDLDPATALKCNCTICSKLGAVWAFAPKTKFNLTSGRPDRATTSSARRACTTASARRVASRAMPRARRPTAPQRSASIFVASRASMSTN